MRWRTGKDYLHMKRPQSAPVKFRPAPKPESKNIDEEPVLQQTLTNN